MGDYVLKLNKVPLFAKKNSEYGRFGNFRDNLIFAYILEFGAS